MRNFLFLWIFVALFSWQTNANAEDLLDVRDSATEPVKIIFDTDIGGDIDDAFALAILHNMQQRGKCELLAVTVSRSRGDSGAFVQAMNAQYGNPDVPVGVNSTNPKEGPGYYANQTLALKNADGTPRYPVPEAKMWDAVELLRKVLSESPDHAVVVVQVGDATNLAELLDTPADQYSPLNGRELVAKKVRLLSWMGGAFCFSDRTYENHKEHNVISDLPAARKVASDWPVEIVFSGYEIGDTIRMSVCSLHNDYCATDAKFLWEAYCAWCKSVGIGEPNHPRPTWDLTSVLFVLRPEADRNYFSLSPRGTVTVLPDGITRFAANPDGLHRCFIATSVQKIRVQEAFVNLTSEFPDR